MHLSFLGESSYQRSDYHPLSVCLRGSPACVSSGRVEETAHVFSSSFKDAEHIIGGPSL